MVIPLKSLSNELRTIPDNNSIARVSLSDNEPRTRKIYNQNENFFKIILDSITFPVFIKDVNSSKYIYINDHAEDVIGYKKDEIIGKTSEDIFSNVLAGYYRQHDLKLLENGDSVVIEEELRKTKSNVLKIFKTVKKLIYDQEGKPLFIVDICEDITFLKDFTEETDSGEQMFSRLFYSSPVGILLFDLKNYHVMDVNQSYLDLIEFEKEDILGFKFDESSYWLETEKLNELIKKAIKTLKTENNEFKIITKSGKFKTVLLSVENISSKESEPWIILTALDITERFNANEEIRRALEKEKSLNVLKKRFIAMISHEFRTPLTTIMLSADLLKRYGDQWQPEEKIKYYDRIQNTILNMTQLMENVLIIDRIDSGIFELHPDYMDIKAFCEAVVDNVSMLNNGEHNILYNSIGNCNRLVLDESLLALIFTNLLTNAIKYSPKGSDIFFESYTNLKDVVFVVKDFGIGIPKKDIEHLFDTFFRASNIGQVAGYGLGLSIVKKCVTTHKGTIMVDSEEKRGTTFTIRIPNLDILVSVRKAKNTLLVNI